MRWLGWAAVAGLVVGVGFSAAGQEVSRGAVAGVVMTVEGDPLEGAEVQVVSVAGGEAAGSVVTDDRGVYRVFGLVAGRYRLRVEAGPGSVVAGSWTYPVGEREGRVVVVEAGTTAGGKDFVVPAVAMREHGVSGETVAGRIEEWVDGAAVGGALVELKGGEDRLMTRTDRAGQFRFTRVPAGQYRVVVWSAGHLREVPARLAALAGSREVKVEAGKPVEDLRLRLMRNGVLTGRVSAEGKPVVRALVSADKLMGAGLGQVAAGYTDDRGEFRVSELWPGKYYVSAVTGPDVEKPRGPAPTFFPDTVRFGDAVAVHVGMDGMAVAVNLEMPVAKKRTVRGVVQLPDGATAVQVRVRPRDPVLAMKFGEKPAEVDAKTGLFVVEDVWPGEYEVVGSAQVRDGHLLDVVAVDLRQGDEDGVRVMPVPLLRVTGEVRTEGEPACATSGVTVEVWSRGAGGASSAHAAVMKDGTFTLEDVQPGSYRVGVSGVSGSCYAKGVAVGGAGADAESVPLTEAGTVLRVALGSDGSRVRGEVVDGQGKGVRGKRVVMVAAGAMAGRDELKKSGVSDAQGHFLLQGIGPGSYEIFELSDEMDEGDVPSSGGKSVEVRAGEEGFVRVVDGEGFR